MRTLQLSRISIRGFTPKTHGSNDLVKKIATREKLLQNISDLESLRAVCRGKTLSVDVCFYLFGKEENQSRAKKDLDNMLKILLDTLPDYTDRAKSVPGLGLIEEDNDDLIFEVHAVKKFVSNETDEGFDLELFEWQS